MGQVGDRAGHQAKTAARGFLTRGLDRQVESEQAGLEGDLGHGLSGIGNAGEGIEHSRCAIALGRHARHRQSRQTPRQHAGIEDLGTEGGDPHR